jgi:hypothetical protein
MDHIIGCVKNVLQKYPYKSHFTHNSEGNRMKCYTIITYFDGEHEPPFYILVEDDYALLHALNVIKTSKEIDYFEVDMEDGQEFYDKLFYKVYPGLRTSTPKVKTNE